MASPEADSRLALVLAPAFEKIVKNASWRKGHSKLAHQCKSLIDRLSHPPPPPSPTSPNSSSSLPGPLRDGGAAVYSLADSEIFLSPLIAACSSGSPRVAEPALDCVQRLVAHSYLHGEADPAGGPDARLLAQLIDAVCGSLALSGGGDDALELLVLKTLLSAVTSTALRIHGDALLQIVRTCYDLYLGSKNPVNQTTAKASLIQMLVIVFRRMEADSSTVPVQPIVVAELMEPADRSSNAAAADVSFVQGFITRIISDIDVVLNPSTPLARTESASKHDGAFETTAVENTNPADLLDSTDKDMLDAKYWEISMYKTALEDRKDELGPEGVVDRDDEAEVQIGNKLRRDAFLVFRALCKLSMKTPPKEAVADPALMKGKIVALELLKILLENAGAVFRTSERMVNGLLKTAQGPPPGATTTLVPPQDVTMKFEAMKCLVAILRSMGDWMNKQLRIPDPYSQNTEITDGNTGGSNELPLGNGNSEEPAEVSDSHSETANGTSEVASIELRRAYKLELQEGISLFNQKPKKGIEFLINAKKVGDSPEEIAAFLKSASGLNKTLIGMEFDEAIRCFLRGFRLPGEAQKIDRIMEKFAERYCYGAIMQILLFMQMSPDDFIRNNRGIDDGKDLPEEYLRSLYDRISKNEIKMKEDNLAPQQIQSSNSNKILGLDGILNIVIRKRHSSTETSDDMIRHMQEQFKEKARKSESAYYSATDVVILRFMIEVCWAPMLAAFSVPLDQSDDETVISLCLEGFRSAVHVTAVMSMETQRDAFVTSLAKFTSLHSAADIKQKNIDAIKAILYIADEDGNYLQEAWEHVLTCVSRFEHLHLLGEGAPPDATFFTLQQTELDTSNQTKSSIPTTKKKGPSSVVARRGTYDSAGVSGQAFGVVTSEQMNNLISNLNLLEQVGIAEVNHIFVRSEKLNSEAIISFVKALCKVSMEELRSASDPRVFSLTKIVEIAHYNMNRIRLVWSSIWSVLSEFFVTIGCSENLSIAIFAMDSLRQLAMKFLERKELANYNFQNEFMKPFVIVMRKSRAVEIRELIIRCFSQMVLARVGNVKSGWKSMFMVFATASYDDHKNIVLLAFEIIEKILRDYFPYITETETTTFTDFLCAKLAEGDIGASARYKNKEAFANNGPPSPHIIKDEKQDTPLIIDKDDHLHLWFPLLAGLSELTFDLRPDIRQSALQVLFDTLRNYGHHFSLPLWEKVFDSVLFPIFDSVRHDVDPSRGIPQGQGSENDTEELDQDAWLYETCKLALQLVVDLFVKFYDTVNPLLKKVLTLLTSFIKRPHQSLAGIGITAFVCLTSSAGPLFVETKWEIVVFSLKEAAKATLPDFSYISSGAHLDNAASDNGNSPLMQENDDSRGSIDDDSDGLRMRNLYSAIGDAKCRAAIQLLLIQAVMEIYNMYRAQISAKNKLLLFEALHAVACHAHKVNSDADLRSKLQELGSLTQMQDPPLLRLENESYHLCLVLLQNSVMDRPLNGDVEVEAHLVQLCREVLEVYLKAAKGQPVVASTGTQPRTHWLIPVGSGKRRELAARAPVVVSTLHAISGLGDTLFRKNLALFFRFFHV
ncbi:Guanine nucleotide-exchange protein [Musa troglodytarum]|uniref:Guanine nucleotide-exchange protein n=1 Tax=Musa troglodytarum TaxID=320322 RepID=A0A9E7FXP5_9LILI|nr:Guanine nucleotide-exchange protein [Musa troglodytarum]